MVYRDDRSREKTRRLQSEMGLRKVSIAFYPVSLSQLIPMGLCDIKLPYLKPGFFKSFEIPKRI